MTTKIIALVSAGLHGFIEHMDVSMETDNVFGGGSTDVDVIEEDERENDNHCGLADLGNAPPIVDVACDEVRGFESQSVGSDPWENMLICAEF